jgi:hypothetical protein
MNDEPAAPVRCGHEAVTMRIATVQGAGRARAVRRVTTATPVNSA